MREKSGIRGGLVTRLVLSAAGLAIAGSASAQNVPITVVSGFPNLFWNASFAGENSETDWRAEQPATNFGNGLRFTFDSMDRQYPEVVNDPTVPGITRALRFPAAAGEAIGTNWEGQAVAGRSGTFEVWFKPDDLSGTHVVLELGAGNKGVAICLEDADLVMSASSVDGANTYGIVHRETLTDTEWHQAVVRVSYVDFTVDFFLDGMLVNSQAIPASVSYRWTSGNACGLGRLAGDPLFPDATVAAEPIAAADFTGPFEGLIGIYRFYGVDLFDSEIADNYDAITDSAASTRRGDVDGDGVADANDQIAVLTMAEAANTDPISPAVQFPFPGRNGGVHMHDPELNELYVGDFHWNSKGGYYNTEPTFLFPSINVLTPVEVNDPNLATIRRAFLMDGAEGFRGPAPTPVDDGTSAHVEFWVKPDDLVGNHCLYEAGGDALGFSVNMIGDQLVAAINSNGDDGFDDVDIASAPGTMTTDWQKIEFVVRRFNGDLGQGIEIYRNGVMVANLNDDPGPDMTFGTADDIEAFNPGTGNSSFVGGNQSGYMSFFSSVHLPVPFTTADMTPFNGLCGPFKLEQSQPVEADLAPRYADETSGQNNLNARSDINADGNANFLDTIEALKQIDAGR